MAPDAPPVQAAAPPLSNPEKRMSDKTRKVLLSLLNFTTLVILLTVVLAGADLVPLGVALQTVALAVASGALIGASFLFNTIRWGELHSGGPSILNRARSDIFLVIVSITALFTVVIMSVIEVLALLVFIDIIPSDDVGAAGSALATSFVLIQTIMLLVYLLALVVRENNPSRYTPSPRVALVANILTPLAGLAILFGVLLATVLAGFAGIEEHQAVYVVTLGVLLEFLAMRIRLRLPSLWSMFRGALNQAKRPDQELAQQLKKRALRTYVIAMVFVAASMAFVGLMLTDTVPLQDANIIGSLTVFYVGAALILVGLVGLRMMQHRRLEPRAHAGDNELDLLVSQRRRSPDEVFRIAVYIVTGLLAVVAGIACVLTGMGNLGDAESGIHPKYATDLFILTAMLGAGPVGFFYNREKNRISAVDDKFPDFLRDLAESARAGMTLPRALVSASQGTYGALTPEIKVMAAQVEWGVDFSTALRRFAHRCKTPLIDRTVALVVEAQKAGGSVVDILTAASEDAREIKQIVAERNAQMSMYNVVIYISFFVFIAVVMVLAAQFIPAFKLAVSGASGSAVGGLTFKDFEVEDFNTIFFQAAVVQAIGGGLVGGVLTKGHPLAGFIHIAIMMGVSWVAFRLLMGLMVAPPAEPAGAVVAALVLLWP